MCIILYFAISIGVKITIKMVRLYTSCEFLLCLNPGEEKKYFSPDCLGVRVPRVLVLQSKVTLISHSGMKIVSMGFLMSLKDANRFVRHNLP